MGYVMRKITVHIDDNDLAAFQAEARASNTGPEDIIARAAHELSVPWDAPIQTATGETLEERRAKRFAILQGDGPLWIGEPGKPKDGLVYEQELRAEWQQYFLTPTSSSTTSLALRSAAAPAARAARK